LISATFFLVTLSLLRLSVDAIAVALLTVALAVALHEDAAEWSKDHPLRNAFQLLALLVELLVGAAPLLRGI
jgi:hypothetical protein